MLRKIVTSSAFVLAFSLAAFGARFTDNLNTLETTVQGLQDGLPDTLDKSQKKAAKAYKSTLKKLGKDTDSLKKDIKLAKSVAGKLSKLGDTGVDVALDGAAESLATDVSEALAAAQQKLNAVAMKVTAAKVQKQIDGGYDALESASGQAKITKRLVLLGKAEARARKADKLAGKVGGGGGGGGGDGKFKCEGRTPQPGESGTVTFDGVEYSANELGIFVDREPGPGISRFTVEVISCNAGTQAYKAMALTIDGEPDPGAYSSNLMGGGAQATELLPPGLGGFFTFGVVTITSRENGKISGSFVTRADIDPPILATFTVNDPNAN